VVVTLLWFNLCFDATLADRSPSSSPSEMHGIPGDDLLLLCAHRLLKGGMRWLLQCDRACSWRLPSTRSSPLMCGGESGYVMSHAEQLGMVVGMGVWSRFWPLISPNMMLGK
jgi:hypothetical protein